MLLLRFLRAPLSPLSSSKSFPGFGFFFLSVVWLNRELRKLARRPPGELGCLWALFLLLPSDFGCFVWPLFGPWGKSRGPARMIMGMSRLIREGAVCSWPIEKYRAASKTSSSPELFLRQRIVT
ncbi:hypothetical protein STAS_17262 [Striga asiatica]|uniref:Uncharacterized protein n=1 Tax=Striga asiatica TaxID=4170 RepID=A0A5A7Q5S4_STRAF|nr:hypothetical protein STAS_17262 [Striga asiatica]